MITRQTKLFYEVAGQFYPSLAEAQKADLLAMLPTDGSAISADVLADWLLANAPAVARILTTTPKSRNRKPRKDKGIPRKSAPEGVA